MEWNDETIAALRVFWAEGHSTAEIGRRMGVSKNAVVGKAHRLSLTARPSPIRRDANGTGPRPPALRRPVGPTLPPLTLVSEAPARVSSSPASSVPVSSEAPTPEQTVLAASPVDGAHVPAPVAKRLIEQAPAPVRPVASRPSRVSVCCWPIGEPGTRSFRFCDAQATNGKPYCSAHAQLAYVKVRDRREEAA